MTDPQTIKENNMRNRVLYLAVALLVVATVSPAQNKISKEEWQKQISDYTTQRNNLKNQLVVGSFRFLCCKFYLTV